MTLIEVMAVVMIIGLASGMVLLTMPPRASPAQQAAQTLGYTLQALQEEAIIVGRPYGLDIGPNGEVSVRVYKAGRWVDHRSYLAPGAERVSVKRADTERTFLRDEPAIVQPGFRLGTQEEVEAALPPSLISDPTGVSLPALFEIEGRRETFELEVTEDGEVHVRQR